MAGDESDRRAILARRKLFIASALASLAATSCEKANPFRPCLSPAPTTTADGAVNSGGPTAPQPCLEPMPPEPDDAGAPEPCLSVAPDPRDASVPRPCLKPVHVDHDAAPQPCLKMAPPPEAPKK